MTKGLVVSLVALIAGLTFSLTLRAQVAPPNPARDEVKQDKWNNIPPHKSAYAGKKVAEAGFYVLSGLGLPGRASDPSPDRRESS